MAVGDVKADLQSIASGGNLDIRPSPGEEWIIHNVYWGGTGNTYLRMCNGTSVVQFDADTTPGARLGLAIHVTNSYFLRINNATGSSQWIAYDGIQTK